MKILDWIKIFSKKPYAKNKVIEYKVSFNNEEAENIIAQSTKLHSDTYKILRNIKTPLYNNIFIMRGKKGFNTFLFNINFDVVISDKDGKVLKTYSDVKPGFISDKIEKASLIMFSTVGTINFYDIKKRDQVTLRRLFIK